MEKQNWELIFQDHFWDSIYETGKLNYAYPYTYYPLMVT